MRTPVIAAQQTETNGPLSPRRRVDIATSKARIEAMSVETKRAFGLLAQLRADYVVIERSVFARLRSVALLTKAMLHLRRSDEKFLALGGTAWENEASAGHGDDAECQAAVRAFAYRTGAVAPSATCDPDVSIIIPAFNNRRATLECLESIARSWFATLQVEIVVVDDGSSDETAACVSKIPTVRLVRSDSNQGFVRACNLGAAEARGRYICFLNNDTQVQNAWLDHLVMLAESDDRIAAVGPKLIYPDGRLEAAGGVIWDNGARAKYGFGSDPSAPEYNRTREVDYCPGACVLVRRAAFEQVGGFSDEFSPAYYEDSDLCFKLRENGYKSYFEPKSQIVHIGGLTWGRDDDALGSLYQDISRPKFVERWHEALLHHYSHDVDNVEKAAWRLGDTEVPCAGQAPAFV